MIDERKPLPIGSVVKVKNTKPNLMIIGLFPLIEKDDKQGYFDFAATTLPIGAVGGDTTVFFNMEDIEEVIFMGYVNLDYQNILRNYDEIVENIDYPKLTVEEFSKVSLDPTRFN